MKETVFYESNRDGWELEIRHYVNFDVHDRSLRPLVMFPGYCMNTFILNFHPRGESMVEYLVNRGFEVFTANLRGQGGSRNRGGNRRFGFRQLALVDIPVVLDAVARRKHADPAQIDAIGCSLGATFLFAYLAHHLQDHPVHSLVAVGGPLRWEQAHPLLKFAFSSPAVAGALPIYKTRAMARRALPLAQRLPILLSIYMNTDCIDLQEADQLVRTVDDPVPYLNRQIAHWLRTRDLFVAKKNVTLAMADVHTPLLCISANADGIVPPATALSAMDALGTDDVTALRAGDDERWFAHADLFISDHAAREVFEPLRTWLHERNA